jgi:hypothetical protein
MRLLAAMLAPLMISAACAAPSLEPGKQLMRDPQLGARIRARFAAG